MSVLVIGNGIPVVRVKFKIFIRKWGDHDLESLPT